MKSFSDSLKEILTEFYKQGQRNSDQEDERDLPRAVAEIKKLVLELIGENEKETYGIEENHEIYTDDMGYFRNELRNEQRSKLDVE